MKTYAHVLESSDREILLIRVLYLGHLYADECFYKPTLQKKLNLNTLISKKKPHTKT